MPDVWRRKQPAVLDGGMSNALEERGHDLSDALWSARLLRDAPAEIAAVHRAYYRAGADIATTASYQASVDGFVRSGVDRAEAQRLIGSSVRLARDVRDELSDDGRHRMVAASVGPYGAVLADGSEYRGRYGVGTRALRDFHRPRLELLASAGADLLAVETIPDLDEAAVLVDLLDEIGMPAWFSYSTAGGLTRARQPLREAFEVAAEAASVVAVGVNCCAPADVLPALKVARTVTEKPLVAYPNAGGSWDDAAQTWTGPPDFDATLVPGWFAVGARYIGGCCRVGTQDIAQVAGLLRQTP